MKKLNNKGLSIIELIVCFVIVAVISVTLLNIIMDYKAKQETENINKLIKSYKDSVTKIIQNDIIKYGLTNVVIDDSEMNKGKIKILFIFKSPLDTLTENKKELIIVGTKDENYIEYPDTVKNSDGTYINQPVKYELPYTTKIYARKNSNLDEKEVRNDIYFLLEKPEVVDYIFYLHIPIEHSETSSTFSINIVSPILP